MTITPEDRARWNVSGTNQQDAMKAGTILGGPMSGASGPMKTAFEQSYATFRRMDEQRVVENQLLAQGAWSGTSVHVPRSKADLLAFRIIKAILLIPLLLVALLIGTGAMTAPGTSGVDRDALSAALPNPAFYANGDPDVAALANQTASSLLNRHFIGQPNWNWSDLSGEQRAAVRAMWLRYIRNPKAFLAMENNLQSGALRLFDSYLLALGTQSSNATPYIDRGRIYLSGLDPINVPYSAQRGRSRSAWFEGALSLPNNAQLEVLAQGGKWDERAYQRFLRGWGIWKSYLPERMTASIAKWLSSF